MVFDAKETNILLGVFTSQSRRRPVSSRKSALMGTLGEFYHSTP